MCTGVIVVCRCDVGGSDGHLFLDSRSRTSLAGSLIFVLRVCIRDNKSGMWHNIHPGHLRGARSTVMRCWYSVCLHVRACIFFLYYYIFRITVNKAMVPEKKIKLAPGENMPEDNHCANTDLRRQRIEECLFALPCARGGPARLLAFQSQGWVTIKDSLGNLFKSIKASVYAPIHGAHPRENSGTDSSLTPPQRWPNISLGPLPI